jgi:dTDP-4-dehydrorhamnose reductase
VTGPAKIAVLGAGGYIGRRLHRAATARDRSAVGTTRADDGLPSLDLRSFDIRGLRLSERGHTHAAIAAGIPGIAACERDPEGTRALNVDATVELAQMLQHEGVIPIVFSSDYVFDGVAGGYGDDASVAPSTEYGRQKAELEMAALLSAGRTVRAASDQVMTPVLVSDVVAAVLALADSRAAGIVNVCGPERRSRLELALAVAEALGADSSLVREISLDDLGEGVSRPKRTDMVAGRLLAETDVRPAPVSEAIPVLAAGYAEVRA